MIRSSVGHAKSPYGAGVASICLRRIGWHAFVGKQRMEGVAMATVITVVLAAATMLSLASLVGFALGWANRAFHVEADPKVERIDAALPGANCGGCGFVGCGEYARAVAAGKTPIDRCTIGGAGCVAALAEIMGVEFATTWPYRPVVHCGATLDQRLKRGDYRGEPTCRSANLVAGFQGCTYGCLGLGDCVDVCHDDAIHLVDGVAVVDYDACTGCGACARACPRDIISMVPFKSDRMLVVGCSNKDFGNDVRAVCTIGCIGCKACERANPLFHITDALAEIDYDRYGPDQSDLAPVVEKCPMESLVFVGKPCERTIDAVRDEQAPEPITAEAASTVDRTDWRGPRVVVVVVVIVVVIECLVVQ